jgi:hypothetical protein
LTMFYFLLYYRLFLPYRNFNPIQSALWGTVQGGLGDFAKSPKG